MAGARGGSHSWLCSSWRSIGPHRSSGKLSSDISDGEVGPADRQVFCSVRVVVLQLRVTPHACDVGAAGGQAPPAAPPADDAPPQAEPPATGAAPQPAPPQAGGGLVGGPLARAGGGLFDHVVGPVAGGLTTGVRGGGLGGGPLSRAGLFDEGPLVQTAAPLASRPPPPPTPAPPDQRATLPEHSLPQSAPAASERQVDSAAAASQGARGVRAPLPPGPPPGHPPPHAKPAFAPAPPVQQPPPVAQQAAQHPLATQPSHPLAHPLAAPKSGTGDGPTTPLPHGQSQQHPYGSPATPSGVQAPPCTPQTPMPAMPNADEMMKEFLGRDVARPAVLLHTQVSQDLAGMRALAAARSWRAVLQVSLIWVITHFGACCICICTDERFDDSARHACMHLIPGHACAAFFAASGSEEHHACRSGRGWDAGRSCDCDREGRNGAC